LNKWFSINEKLNGDVDIVLPISSLLVKNDDHYSRIKKALVSLLDKKIIINNNMNDNDDKIWKAFSFIERPEIDKRGVIEFRLHPEIYKALLDFSKGFRKYELETAMAFKSVYSMRFYELISGQKKQLEYSIEKLRNIFQLEDKYKNPRHFISYVIDPAKKELDLKAPYSFNYQLEYEKDRNKKGRKKIVGITFVPIYNLKNRNGILDHNDKCRNNNLSNILIHEEKEIFILLGFSEQELKTRYYDLILDIDKARKQGKIVITSSVIEYSKKAKNPKTYLIKSLMKEIKNWKEGLLKKQLTNENDRNVYDKEKASVYSFLKNHLILSGIELEKTMNYVIERGSEAYLNELVRAYNDNNSGKIDDEKIRKHLKRGIENQ
jgi:plasmid replication initiation protein